MRLTDLVSGLRPSKSSSLPVAVFVAVLGILVFFYVSREVGENEFLWFDSAILLALRDPADLSNMIGPTWLAESVAEITALGGYTLIVVIVAAAVGFLLAARRAGAALFLLLSVVSGTLVSQFLKSFYDRPRPDVVPPLDLVHTASFPSGHAMMSTLVYLTLAVIVVREIGSTRLRIYVFSVAIAIALAVGLSRIFLGVHWPSDVLAGWALGAAWAALSWLVTTMLRRWHKRHGGAARGR